MAQSQIVVIEDERDIRDVISHNLSRAGFSVTAFPDGESGLAAVRAKRPALVVLDLMLPGLDGLAVCRKLHAESGPGPLPVVMVTARGEESDIVQGLESGADDYVVKPFRPRELVARVKAVLRRLGKREGGGEAAANAHVITLDGVVLDATRHSLEVDGHAAALTATEMRLLEALASQRGRVFTRDQLLTRLRGDDSSVVDRNIDVHVGQIRQKLGRHRSLIETIRGIGYRFRDESS